jgi:transcriptional regulator with XRE-family HTH domain
MPPARSATGAVDRAPADSASAASRPDRVPRAPPPDRLRPPRRPGWLVDKPPVIGIVEAQAVDRVKIGNTFRAIRVEMRLRQADVAERAGVSQQTVSDLECGRFGGLSLDTYCRCATAIDADVQLAPRWRGPKLDRLLDRRHALLQNQTVEVLLSIGWEVRTEASFNVYGDRGSVDVLAWHPELRALLVIEVKTEITDLQETLRVLDMKRRVVPGVRRRDTGLDPRAVGTVLVMPDASTHRDLVERHAALVSASLPTRTVGVRRWILRPRGDLRGVWFLRNTGQGGAMWKVQPSRRVRAAPARAADRSKGPTAARSSPVGRPARRPTGPEARPNGAEARPNGPEARPNRPGRAGGPPGGQDRHRVSI